MTIRPCPISPTVKSVSPAGEGADLAEPAHALDLQRIEIGKHLVARRAQ